MKNVVYIVLSSVLLTGCTGEQEVKEEQKVKKEKVVAYLQDRNGLMYELNTEVRFTGVYIEKYDNGQKKTENHYKDGKLDGLSTEWRENGQKEREWNYKDGTIMGVLRGGRTDRRQPNYLTWMGKKRDVGLGGIGMDRSLRKETTRVELQMRFLLIGTGMDKRKVKEITRTIRVKKKDFGFSGMKVDVRK